MSSPRRQIGVSTILVALLGAASLYGQAPDPVPFIQQPLLPPSYPPGAGTFGLQVNGTGFTVNSIVRWNGIQKATSWIDSRHLQAAIPATDVATATTAWVTVDNTPLTPGGTSNLAFLHVTNPTTSVSMSKTDYATGTAPVGVVTQDFNGDGVLDLAVANQFGDTVSILLGNGDGTFLPTSPPTFATGANPTWMTTGDFNADGKLDLAVSNFTGGTISILLGIGDGTFQTLTPFAAGGAGSLTAGDFNGDGKLDLARANAGTSSGSIQLGNGDGTFQTPTTFVTGSDPQSVATGDFNADGKLDLAFANAGSSTVSILLGIGDGTFQPKVDFATGITPKLVTTADFNADGKLDLAVANRSETTVSILLGIGDGTFQPKVDYLADSFLDSVTTGDFNGDGKLDVATLSNTRRTVTILLGFGDGTFQTTTTFFAVGGGPVSATAGDFNGDGRLDFAVANSTSNTVSVLLQTPPPAPAVQLSATSLIFGSQVVSTTSPAMSVTLTNSGTAPLNFTSFNVQVSTTDTTLSPDFSSNNSCGSSLGAGLPCTINAFFTPLVPGPRSADIKIVSDAPGSPHFISLSGTGLLSTGVITPSVPNIDFGSHPVGSMTTQTLTLNNTGSGTLNIQGLTFTGNFALDAGTTTCPNPGPLAASASCNIGITFSAYLLGANNGQLAITHDAAGSPTLIPLTGTGTAVPFARGEVFISLADGKVERRRTDGSLIQVMDTQKPSYSYGMAFDRDGNLYVTSFGFGDVTKFDNTGVLLGTFGSAYNGAPESIVFDAAGNAYVGTVDGDNTIKKFDSSGNPLAQYAVAVENRGSDWIDLGANQCTMYYTSEGTSVKRFDVCTNTQLPDLTNALPGLYAFGLRVLASGEVLVANSNAVQRLDASGNIVKTYEPTPAEFALFALNLDPDGTSFWTGDYGSGKVYKFDIASGTQLLTFDTPALTIGGGFGITVFGEITSATSPQVTVDPASVNFPGNPVGVNCPTKPITITNDGPGDLIILGLSGITAPFTIDPVVTGTTCLVNTPVASGMSCVINFKFLATATGTVNQTLTITSNAQGSPHSVAVSGTGTPACALVAKVRSTTLLRGTDAQDFEIADGKPSCTPVSLNLSCSVANPAACALNPAVIAPSGASTLRVSNLRAVTADSVAVQVNSVSEFRAASELISVRFADFAFTRAPDTASVLAGETASYSLAIRPLNGLEGPLALSCSGAPRGATCSVTPSAVTLDGSSLAQVKVRVSTAARAAAGPGALFTLPPLGGHRGLLLLLLVLLGVGVAVVSRARTSPVRTPALQRLVLAVAMLAMLLWASCGGGGSMNFNSGGTPAGTFTLTITGTYTATQGNAPATLTNTTTLTLKVN